MFSILIKSIILFSAIMLGIRLIQDLINHEPISTTAMWFSFLVAVFYTLYLVRFKW